MQFRTSSSGIQSVSRYVPWTGLFAFTAALVFALAFVGHWSIRTAQAVTVPACPDMTGDQFVDLSDLAALAAAIGTYPGTYTANADLNGDGKNDQQDVPVWEGYRGRTPENFSCASYRGLSFQSSVQPIGACPDLTGAGGVPDGFVDASDLAMLAKAIGDYTNDPQTYNAKFDLNGDGKIDQQDASVWDGYRGRTDITCGGSVNAQATQVTVPQTAILSITKTDGKTTAAAGEATTYTITVTNSGNAAAYGVKVSDSVPGTVENISGISDGGVLAGSTITWDNLTVAANSSRSLSFSGTIIKSLSVGTTKLTNTATLGCSATATDCSYSGTATDLTTVTVAPVAVSAKTALTITKTVNVTDFVAPGSAIIYTVIVANGSAATDTARNVVVTDTLPPGFTFTVDGTTTTTLPAGSLEPGKSKTFAYTVKVSADQLAGVYTNSATAKADNADPVTATAAVDVRNPLVLSAEVEEKPAAPKARKVTVLAETGPGLADYLAGFIALALVLAGAALRSRQMLPNR